MTLAIGLVGLCILGMILGFHARADHRLREIRDVLIEIRDAWRT